MTWAADGTTVWGTDYLKLFAEMGGDIYVLAYDADGASGWHKRTAPAIWTQCTQVAPAFIGEGYGDFWNSLIWDVNVNDQIWRSPNGTVWTMDKDINADYGTTVFTQGTIGGQGTGHLMVAHWNAGASQMEFAHRSTGGIWTNNVATAFPGLSGPSSLSIVRHHSGYIFWYCFDTNFSGVTRRWDGSSWSTDPQLGHHTVYRFLYHNGLLFAATDNGVYRWRGAAYGWYQETGVAPADSISVGSDGELYFATGAQAKIYQRRAGGNWVRVSTYPGDAGGVGTEHAGTLYLGDDDDSLYIYALGWGAAASAGLYSQAMDVDGDGNQLYIGLIDIGTTFPILVAVGLPLTVAATGARVFNPGAGDAINVKAIDIGDNLVVAGNFGNNEQVETSDDGGGTWTDIDRDAWGAETAQPLIVAPLTIDEVMVALATAQDITETFDAGATAWVVNNAALGFTPSAMAKLVNGNEMIVGNDAANQIFYSPNRGTTLVDITGAFGGIPCALEITR